MRHHTSAVDTIPALLKDFSITDRAALSLSGLSFRADSPHAALVADPREQLRWVRSLGFRSVVLDCTAPLMRPRQLDRSARRDVASMLRRNDLVLAGIDLFVPPLHLTDPAHQDRAFAAIGESLALAVDLASLSAATAPCVSVLAPPVLAARDIAALAQLTDQSPATLAVIAWPVTDDFRAVQLTAPKLNVAIDPARVMAQGGDPARELSRIQPAPASIRLSDFDGISRVPLGKGNLNLLAYTVAAAIANSALPLILDLSGLPDSHLAVEAALRATRP